MFTDESASLIYACHVLEYFDRVEVVAVLREWARVLRPGGELFVAVPDFAALAEIYRRSSKLDLIIGPLFGRWTLVEGDTERTIYHRTTWDFESLKRTFESVGLNNVARYNWRDTLFRDYDDYSQAYIPHMDKENGTLISLNVRAQKPA
jgi:ubiquinone/menaquinone biosynthesis C-methylase UbiE